MTRKKTNTWGVVATVREPSPLVVAFCCYYRALGADQVYVFFDNPKDPAIKLVEMIDGCTATLCDDSYWQSVGYATRPSLQTKRQTVNANVIMQTTELDWLLHADADEFLVLPDGFADEIAQIPDEAEWVHIPNMERCWIGEPGADIFDGVFRAPLHDLPDLASEVYGKRAAAMSGGLAGYSAGKALARTGDAFMAIHKVREYESGPVLPYADAPGAIMLHFDGLSPMHWAVKNLRYALHGEAMNRLVNKERKTTLGTILMAGNPEAAALHMHKVLFQLDYDQAEKLADAERLWEFEPGIQDAVAKLAPKMRVDFTTKAFDRAFAREMDALGQHIRRQKRQAQKLMQEKGDIL